MAFALSIKSKLDFPAVGKNFLTLTLIVASFTLIYSTLLLDFVLKWCGIANYCKADNFDESALNNIRNKNCFEILKIKIKQINEKYLKKLIRNSNSDESNVSVTVNNNSNCDENRYYKGFGNRENLKVNEVKNKIDNENKNVEIHKQTIEILDKNDKRGSFKITSFDNTKGIRFNNQIDEN